MTVVAEILNLLGELGNPSEDMAFFGNDYLSGKANNELRKKHGYPVRQPPGSYGRAAATKRRAPRSGRGGKRRKPARQFDIPTMGKDGFQVCVRVGDFKMGELDVKVADQVVIIEGNPEKRDDGHSLRPRKFLRRYDLPKGFDESKIALSMSADKVLTINIPKADDNDSSDGAEN